VTLVLQINARNETASEIRQRLAFPIRPMPDGLDGRTSADPGRHDPMPAMCAAKLRNFALNRTARST
jgi:hypothetical protein